MNVRRSCGASRCRLTFQNPPQSMVSGFSRCLQLSATHHSPLCYSSALILNTAPSPSSSQKIMRARMAPMLPRTPTDATKPTHRTPRCRTPTVARGGAATDGGSTIYSNCYRPPFSAQSSPLKTPAEIAALPSPQISQVELNLEEFIHPNEEDETINRHMGPIAPVQMSAIRKKHRWSQCYIIKHVPYKSLILAIG